MRKGRQPCNRRKLFSKIAEAEFSGLMGYKDPITLEPIRTSDPYRDEYNSNNFSRDDIEGITQDGAGMPEYTGYLGTPSGVFRKFVPATNANTEL
jgi:hypothetical protein